MAWLTRSVRAFGKSTPPARSQGRGTAADPAQSFCRRVLEFTATVSAHDAVIAFMAWLTRSVRAFGQSTPTCSIAVPRHSSGSCALLFSPCAQIHRCRFCTRHGYSIYSTADAHRPRIRDSIPNGQVHRYSSAATFPCLRRAVAAAITERRPNIADHICERHKISPEQRPSIVNRICARRKISPERRPHVANRICERRKRSSDERPNVAIRICASRKTSAEWRPNVAHRICECWKISPERRPNVNNMLCGRRIAPRERARTLRLATSTKRPEPWSARARTRSMRFFTCMDQVLRNLRAYLSHARRASRASDQVLRNVKNEPAPRHRKVAAPRGHVEFMKSCDFKSEHLFHFIGRIVEEPCCLRAPRGACARF